MNVIKCANGHFYDGDILQCCPECGEIAVSQSLSVPMPAQNKRKGLFGRKKQNDAQDLQTSQSRNPAMAVPDSFNNMPGSSSAPAYESNPTEALNPEDLQAATAAKKPSMAGDVAYSGTANSGSLADKVRSASASSDGKTMSYFSAVMNSSSDAAHQDNKTGQVDPVVGWLVCIKGPNYGESYSLGAGVNSIGRSENNRIVIGNDNAVSREKHTFIIYEPKHKQFYIKPGDSTGLTYVNDEYLLDNRILVSGDIVEIGNSQFYFMPLCGTDFTWEPFMRNNMQ